MTSHSNYSICKMRTNNAKRIKIKRNTRRTNEENKIRIKNQKKNRNKSEENSLFSQLDRTIVAIKVKDSSRAYTYFSSTFDVWVCYFFYSTDVTQPFNLLLSLFCVEMEFISFFFFLIVCNSIHAKLGKKLIISDQTTTN